MLKIIVMEEKLEQIQDWMKQSNRILQSPVKKLRIIARVLKARGYSVQFDLVNKKIYITKIKSLG